MLRTILTKTIRERWVALAGTVTGLSVWLLFAMILYSDIDMSIYTDLPEGIRKLMGIPEGAEAATLAYNVMIGFAAALTLAAIAISMGSAAIAGEERKGTIGLLLGNPKSRTHLLISKAGAMVLLISAASMVLWGAGYLAPALVDTEIGKTQVGAMMLHLGINAIFYGFMAIAISAWTGNRTLSSGIPAGIMTISYFAVGLLPLVERLKWLASLFPWYYFASSEPLINGINWVHLSVLLGGSALFGVVALVGLNRRDLRSQNVAVSLLDRLRENPRTQQVFERIAGSTRVSRLWIKTTSEHQGLLTITAFVMFSMMGVLMGPMYTAMKADIAAATKDFPEAIMAVSGGGDMSTPEGFFLVETFSISAPIAIMIVTLLIGARGLAGEEADHTMGLLLANPIKRSAIVIEQAFAMTVYGILVGAATCAGVATANFISGLDMSYAAIAATSLLVTLLGVAFGTLALALSAAFGRVKIAIYVTIGVALTSHLLYSFLPLSDSFAPYARLTPTYYFLSSEPLVHGMNWAHGAVLAVLAFGLVVAAIALFERRDLREG